MNNLPAALLLSLCLLVSTCSYVKVNRYEKVSSTYYFDRWNKEFVKTANWRIEP